MPAARSQVPEKHRTPPPSDTDRHAPPSYASWDIKGTPALMSAKTTCPREMCEAFLNEQIRSNQEN